MALLDKLTAALHAPVRGVEAAPAVRLAANTELKERLARRIAPELEAAVQAEDWETDFDEMPEL